MTEAAGGRRRRLRDLWRRGSRVGTSGVPDDSDRTESSASLHGRFRRFLGFRLMRATTPLRTVIRSGEPIPARARLKSVRIEERYFYDQHISLNDSTELRQDPTGEIRMFLPYDGEKYFTRQAHEDVVRARNHGADRDAALVGFIALSDYGKTDLGSVLSLDEHHGSHPIEVRLPVTSGPNEIDPLLADDSSCLVTIDYKPRDQSEKAAPVRLDIEVQDPDNAEIPWPPKRSFDDFHSNIMRQVEFVPDLSLFVTVQLNLPRKLAAGAHATVRRSLSAGRRAHPSVPLNFR
jgi:hypothetical protein